MKTYIREMKLRRWFPPHDRFATTVARLCILREDFAMEMAGIYAPRLKAFDGNSIGWRRLYFWRNLIRTLAEIRSVLESLSGLPDFKRALDRRHAWKSKFTNLRTKLNKGADAIKRSRNSLGGHVSENEVARALSGMDLDKYGYVEAGPGRTLKDLHYRFVGEIVSEMLVAGVPEEDKLAEVKTHVRMIADLLPVFEIIEKIFTIYVETRDLV